jgi:hypothetical protein
LTTGNDVEGGESAAIDRLANGIDVDEKEAVDDKQRPSTNDNPNVSKLSNRKEHDDDDDEDEDDAKCVGECDNDADDSLSNTDLVVRPVQSGRDS